jgi:hypothetical protein
MSFAFRCSDQEWSEDYSQRRILETNIHRGDVSIVTNGASPTTEVALRYERAAMVIHDQWERFLETLVEWRDFTLQPQEDRAGKVLSTANHEFLMEMLSLFSTADDAVDEGQARLSDFLSVPNPDKGTDAETDTETESETEANSQVPGESTAQPDFHVTYSRSAEVRARLLLREARR